MRDMINEAIQKTRARLRWRARRGLLENDLLLTRFFDHHEHELSDQEVLALTKLFEMSDNDLLDVLLNRKQLAGDYQTKEVEAVVLKIQNS